MSLPPAWPKVAALALQVLYTQTQTNCIQAVKWSLSRDNSLDLQQVSYTVAGNRTRKAGEDTLQLKVFKKPFASGGCRLAYYAQDSNGVR